MPGAIVKSGGTGGASTFGQVAGDPADNAALVAFVTAKVAAVAPSSGGASGDVDGGSAAATGTGDIDGGNANGT